MTLRVAYVLNVFPKFSETFVAGELAELHRRGVDVRILSLRSPSDDVRHDVVESARLLARTYYDEDAFRAELHRFRPHLLHAHFALQATAKARQLAAELHLPFTFTAHGYDVYRTPPPDLRERAEAAAAVVTVSEANVAHLSARHGVPLERLHLIPCGIDLERFGPAPDAVDAAGGSPPVLLCVGRLVAVKNHALLLAACALLRSRGVPFRCVLVGDGETLGEVEELRRELGLETCVELTGALTQAEVTGWWRRAAVGVLPSTSEGMPIALMEAAASGVPVVATCVGGVPELVADGVTGLLVPSGDTEALAAALERLLVDRAEARRLGAAARSRAEARFSVTAQIDALLALWRSILEAPRDQPPGPPASPAIPATPVEPRAVAAHQDGFLPTLGLALDPGRAEAELRRLAWIRQRFRSLELVSARVVRHKPGKRVLIEYELLADGEPLSLLGKIRSKRFGNSGFRLLSAFWNAGFSAECHDGVSVPEPVGTIPGFQMWLQRKVPGRCATELLTPSSFDLAERIARAAHKVHGAGVPFDKRHTMADELRILHERLPKVAAEHPALAARVERLLSSSDRLGARILEPAASGIHRDFFSDQLLVDGERLVLLDFDLYCGGDPALDIGNFLGHVTALALRLSGDPLALAPFEAALGGCYARLAGDERREAAETYAILTLVRHVYLSTLSAEWRGLTGSFVTLSEERLALRGAL